VILVLYPNSDLRTAKIRPAVVVQANNLQTGLPQVVAAMVTSKLFRAGHPSRVTISMSREKQSGLLSDSVVMTDNLATILHTGVERVIGSVPMNEIDTALRHTLSI
jgi:mRNA interferase MazF